MRHFKTYHSPIYRGFKGIDTSNHRDVVRYFEDNENEIIIGMNKNNPQYCTLPHIISLLLHADIPTLVEKVSEDFEAAGFVTSLRQAIKNESTISSRNVFDYGDWDFLFLLEKSKAWIKYFNIFIDLLEFRLTIFNDLPFLIANA